MFTTFGEQERGRGRRPWVTAVSVGAHVLVVSLATAATMRGDDQTPPEPELPPVHYVPPRALPPETPRTAARLPGAPQPAGPVLLRALPPLATPDVIPDGLPPIELGRPAITADEFGASDPERAGGPLGEDAGGHGGGDGVWSGPQVEVPAAPRPGNRPPRYPAALEQARVAGTVAARFVVDTSGRVEPGSLQIDAAAEPLFADAVRRVVGGYRFTPARVGRRPVRQLVEMPFAFQVPR